ncbi:MAG: HEPN domain-containing protein [Treponema sp.]|jgi:HEPN domain-containing protein|nr:HEPN domain-containing protein [Treponema sp.]
MDKSLVTETADELLNKAEKDIVTIKVLFPKKFYPENLMYDIMCFHATMAVEKLLKSYIISNGKNIEKTHDLDYLRESAMTIESSFIEIKKDCVTLNDFVPSRKYGDEVPITKQNMNDIIKSLNNICGFPPIKAMRDSFRQTHKFEIIDESTVKPANSPKNGKQKTGPDYDWR